MNEKKQYLIDEDTLKELLHDSFKLSVLEMDGVDNWEWYMEGEKELLADCISQLPWHEGKSHEDLVEYICTEDYDVDCLVQDTLDAFWEEHTCPVAGYGDNVEPYIHGVAR